MKTIKEIKKEFNRPSISPNDIVLNAIDELAERREAMRWRKIEEEQPECEGLVIANCVGSMRLAIGLVSQKTWASGTFWVVNHCDEIIKWMPAPELEEK